MSWLVKQQHGSLLCGKKASAKALQTLPCTARRPWNAFRPLQQTSCSAGSGAPTAITTADPVQCHDPSSDEVSLTGNISETQAGPATAVPQGALQLTKAGKVDKRRLPRSPEVRAKIAQSKLGKQRPEWVRQKLSEGMRERSLETRAKMSQAKLGTKHSLETRAKIAASTKATKAKQRMAKLAEQQAAARQGSLSAGRAPLGPSTSGRQDSHGGRGGGQERALGGHLSDLAREKAVVEMTALRRELNAWMLSYEKVHGSQPVMNDTAKTHPEVYKRFVRYVALRELVRQGR